MKHERNRMIALKGACAAFQPKRAFTLHIISSIAEAHPDHGHSTAMVKSLHASLHIH